MFSSTDRQLREQHYNKLIKIYHHSLSNTIRKLGSDPEKLFTFNDLLGELQRFGRYGLIMAPILLQVVTSSPDDIPDMDKFADDMASNKTTLDEGMAEFKKASTLHVYNQKVRDVFKDGILLGYV